MDRTNELTGLLAAEKSRRDADGLAIAGLRAAGASKDAQIADLQNQLATAQQADTIGADAVAAMQAEEAIVAAPSALPPTTN